MPDERYVDLPRFDQLPVKRGAPERSAWGVFGDDDQVGTLNLLTPERVVQAARLVRKGLVFRLDLPLHLPDPPLYHWRTPLKRTFFPVPDSFEVAFDETIDNFAPQNSSQWDGLTHVRHPSLGFYNGFQKEHLTGGQDTRLGIEHWARRGIVGRGVLLDVERHLQGQGVDYDAGTTFLISVDILESTRRAQGIELRQGDILLLRTGWVKYYLGLAQSERDKLAHEFAAAGLRPGNDMAQYLWDHHVAAIGADSPSVERWPIDQELGFFHIQMIVLFGMAIGELWNLEGLAEDCAGDGVYECMVTSAPLHLRGGVGSPANALAIK